MPINSARKETTFQASDDHQMHTLTREPDIPGTFTEQTRPVSRELWGATALLGLKNGHTSG